MAFRFEIGNGEIRLGFTKPSPPPQLKKEERSYPYDQLGGGIFSNFGFGEPSSANERVNELRAMRISTVYTCQKILAETLASMPPNVFQKTKDGKKKIAYAHTAQYVIHDAPNASMTAYDFWFTLMLHASGWGNGYAVIKRDIYNEVNELDILCPWEITPKSVEGDLYYVHRTSGTDGQPVTNRTYKADELLVIKGFTLNGKIGISPIRFNSETFGFNIKQQKYRGKAFGTKPPGYLQSEQNITEKQIPDIKNHWSSQTTGDEIGSTPLLYNGLKYIPISFNPAELQLLETSEVTKEEICGIFRIPPIFVENYEKSTYTAEQQDLVFMKYTMLPWVMNIEQECNAKLYSSTNRTAEEPLFTKFNMDVFLRADYKTRTEGYRNMISSGVMSIDEARELENMDAISEEWSGQHFLQMNMIPLDKMNQFVEKLSTMPAPHAGGAASGEGRSMLDFMIEKGLLKMNGHEVH